MITNEFLLVMWLWALMLQMQVLHYAYHTQLDERFCLRISRYLKDSLEYLPPFNVFMYLNSSSE